MDNKAGAAPIMQIGQGSDSPCVRWSSSCAPSKNWKTTKTRASMSRLDFILTFI